MKQAVKTMSDINAFLFDVKLGVRVLAVELIWGEKYLHVNRRRRPKKQKDRLCLRIGGLI